MAAMITQADILHKTHYGLTIYACILRKFYPCQTVIKLSGYICALTKNPFNHNKKSLQIIYQNQTFMFSDILLPAFRGTPFQFAQKYYQLSGTQLLQKINSDLHLGIGEPSFYYRKSESQNQTKNKPDFKPGPKTSPLTTPLQIPCFSLFRKPVTNRRPFKTISIVQVYYRIRSQVDRPQTLRLRSINNDNQRRRFKAQNFDYITFSGIFSSRCLDGLIRHSGLLTLDFDHIPDPLPVREILLNDPCFNTELLFISPSGHGLKWIVKIDCSLAPHRDYFLAISAYLTATYRLFPDQSGKDIARACFIPCDPLIYINPDYLKQ